MRPWPCARLCACGARRPVPGVKLELFIFDTFPLAGSATALVEVARAEEFAPVKNAPGAGGWWATCASDWAAGYAYRHLHKAIVAAQRLNRN